MMNVHTTATGLWFLTSILIVAQTPAPLDYAARVQSVVNLKAHIAQREARFELLKQDLIALDGRVEKQIDQIVTTLSSIRDSSDSRTRVAQIKGEVIGALERTISIYRQRRMDLFERMRKDSSVPQDELEKNLKTFDERIGKRVAQVMELAKSFPGHQDVKKYESYGSSYFNGYYRDNVRITDEWQQNRRDNTSGEVARRDLVQKLDKALATNQSRQQAITDALANRNLSDSERSLQQEELGRVDAASDYLTAQRRQLALPGDTATRAIGADEAHDAGRMLDDARADLARDFWDIMSKYGDLDAERTRLCDLRKNLADREEWLKNNPPAAK
jgi:hypothetical protein